MKHNQNQFAGRRRVGGSLSRLFSRAVGSRLKPMNINPKFKSLIPPLAPDELSQLEANLLADGCRDPLVTWNDTLLDGHNRLEICNRHKLPFKTKAVTLADERAALDWIDANQYGRRNLTPDQMSLIRGRRYNRMKKPQGGDKKSETVKSKAQIEPLISTAAKLAKEHGVSAATIKRDAKFAEKVEAAPALLQAVMNRERTTAHVAHNSGDNEWYTPKEFIEAAAAVMGDIDIDPASSEEANNIVKAARFFTADNDGLKKKWEGKVWMNPPYAGELIGKFTGKLASEFTAGNVTEAIALVNNATETKWFQTLCGPASAVCFPLARVKFWHPRKVATPLQGQAVIYLGKHAKTFADAFAAFGIVFRK